MFKPDKSMFTDSNGRFITQGIFFETTHNRDFAIYTLKEYDHEFDGKKYPSLKQIYLAHEDPLEYDFANTYLHSWNHWQRICKNALITSHIEQWREELELKLRSQAVKDIISKSCDDSQGSFQAAKWLADKGWDKRLAGRPSKEEKEKRDRIAERINDDFASDVSRLADYRKN